MTSEAKSVCTDNKLPCSMTSDYESETTMAATAKTSKTTKTTKTTKTKRKLSAPKDKLFTLPKKLPVWLFSDTAIQVELAELHSALEAKWRNAQNRQWRLRHCHR